MAEIFVFIFGAIIGSFLNVVVFRLPKSQKLTGHSRCVFCGHPLGPLDLVPVLSFLFLRGRCRYCKTSISSRYVIIELITGFLFVLAWAHLKPDSLILFLELLRLWWIAAILLVIFIVDLEHYLILDSMVFYGSLTLAVFNLSLDLAAGRQFVGLNTYFFSGLLAAAALAPVFFLLWYLSKGRALGFGDVKLAIFLGLALGWPIVLIGLLASVLLGGLVSVFLLTLTSKTLKSRVPFGTFLSLGTLIGVFYGERLLRWYLALLGF